MSRPPKGPRLFPRRPKGRTPYWAILDTGGFERSTGHCLTKRKEAEAELARYIAGKHKTTVGGHTPKLVLVCDVLDSYLTSKTPTTGADQRAVKSFTDLTYFIERLAEWWDGKSLSDVKKSSCGDYVRWRTKQVHRRATKTSSPKLVSPSTARRELEVLRAAVNDYHAEFTLEAVPVVSLPERSESRIRWLSRSEAARCLLACLGWRWDLEAGRIGWIGHIWEPTSGAFKAMDLSRVQKGIRKQVRRRRRHLARFMIIGLFTGTRAMAMLRARWVEFATEPWVDVENGLFYRRGAEERQTNKRQPPVRLPEKLLVHMRRWQRLDLANGITHVVHADGKPVDSIRTAWEGMCEDAGLDHREVTRHTLRHSAATWLMQGGMPLGEAADFVGMTEEVLRAHYYHFHPDYQAGTDNHFKAAKSKHVALMQQRARR